MTASLRFVTACCTLHWSNDVNMVGPNHNLVLFTIDLLSMYFGSEKCDFALIKVSRNSCQIRKRQSVHDMHACDMPSSSFELGGANAVQCAISKWSVCAVAVTSC